MTTIRYMDIDDKTNKPVVREREATPEEDAEITGRENESRLRGAAEQALGTNRTFLALPAPTNAQTLRQVKTLTQQTNALIRLVLGQLDGTD